MCLYIELWKRGTHFSAAISADVCPVNELGPSSKNKFGNPFITEELYASGPPYSDQCSVTVLPLRPRISRNSIELVLNPVANTMTSAGIKPLLVLRPFETISSILASVRRTLSLWRESRYPQSKIRRWRRD